MLRFWGPPIYFGPAMSVRFQIGERIGDYKIVGFLGAGGMGSVYHGVHTKINRSAAIKVLPEVASSSNFIERFFNEARLQSSLHHPNIATLYDFQESGSLLFIVMEYVDGETLDALISRGYFSVEDALMTFEPICDAVAFIHSNNIVHRDIKPQNIKLASNGMVKLLDFGIAKGEVSHGLTRVGGVIGTPTYLAPEQLAGEPATPQSDIWALGVLFYEMLTGTEPFKGTSLNELYFQITTSKFEQPEKLNSVVPPDISRIVSRCLETDRARRYQSVTEILADIQNAKARYQLDPTANAKKGFAFQRKGLMHLGKKDSKADIGTGFVEVNEPPKYRGTSAPMVAALGLGGLLVFFVFVGVVIWAISGPTDLISNNVNSKPLPAAIPTVASRSGVPAANKLQGQQAAPLVPTADRPRVRVEVSQGTADVYRDGQLVGTTPYEIEGAENERVDLTLKRNGFMDVTETIDITTRRKVYTFSLKPK